MPEETNSGAGTTARNPHKYIRLTDPVDTVHGIGSQGAVALARLNIFTVADLLRHYPSRWDDRTRFRSAGELQHGEVASLTGTVAAIAVKKIRPGMKAKAATAQATGPEPAAAAKPSAPGKAQE